MPGLVGGATLEQTWLLDVKIGPFGIDRHGTAFGFLPIEPGKMTKSGGWNLIPEI
jgi:hypothetical protein